MLRRDPADEIGLDLAWNRVDEPPEDAAVRETCEEAGLISKVDRGRELGHLDYTTTRPERARYCALTT
jgi:8-oxo-dGTP pyrophosphatase MutT (NUDIX family)